MLIRPNTIMGRTNGRNMVVKKLLAKYNVNLDLKDRQYGQTLLSWAAEHGHEASVQRLLNTGLAEIDSKGKVG